MERRIENIYHHENYRSIIREDFFLRSSINTQYSLRAYAKDLNLSPSILSMVFQNKRHLSISKLEEVAKRIGLKDQEKEFLTAIYNKEKNKSGALDIQSESTYNKHRPAFPKNDAIDEERKLITQHLNFVLVFNAFDFAYYRRNPKQVPIDLNIAQEEYDRIFKELVSKNLIKLSEGRVEVLREHLVVGDDSHEEILQHAIDLKHFSLSLLKKHRKVVDPNLNVSITFHLMLDEEARLKTVDAIKKLQHEVLNISKACKNPNQYFILPVDFQKVFETPSPIE